MSMSASVLNRSIRPRTRSLTRGWVTRRIFASSACLRSPGWHRALVCSIIFFEVSLWNILQFPNHQGSANYPKRSRFDICKHCGTESPKIQVTYRSSKLISRLPNNASRTIDAIQTKLGRPMTSSTAWVRKLRDWVPTDFGPTGRPRYRVGFSVVRKGTVRLGVGVSR